MTFFRDIMTAPFGGFAETIIGHFRREPYRNGQGKQKRVQPAVISRLEKTVHQKDRRRHHQNEADQHPGNTADSLIKAWALSFRSAFSAIRPKEVFPVTITMPSAEPLITLLPINARLRRSIGAETEAAPEKQTFPQVRFPREGGLIDKRSLTAVRRRSAGGACLRRPGRHDPRDQLIHRDLHPFSCRAGRRPYSEPSVTAFPPTFQNAIPG